MNNEWVNTYAKHRSAIDHIQHRHSKPTEVEVQQRCKDANMKVHNSSQFKRKETLQRIINSNQILSRKIQDIEKRKLSKMQEAVVKITTKGLRDRQQVEIAQENQKQADRLNKLRSPLI